jgi:hypothetical protein
MESSWVWGYSNPKLRTFPFPTEARQDSSMLGCPGDYRNLLLDAYLVLDPVVGPILDGNGMGGFHGTQKDTSFE